MDNLAGGGGLGGRDLVGTRHMAEERVEYGAPLG